VANCIADGIPVKGYMYWSLLDNFEWQKGFSMTFGLIAVDRTTQQRSVKPSLEMLGGLV
jgi:beta-glucosidase